MVSSLGLTKFNPVEMKQRSPQENASISNSSSAASNKSLDKSPKKLGDSKENNSKETNFDQQVKSYSKNSENKSTSNDNKSNNIDKDQIKEFQKEIQKNEISDIPQMQMLQGVQPVHINQAAQSDQPSKVSESLNLNVKVSSQTEPVLKFMKAMQENFGINPTQIMKALSEMPQEIMLQSPHKAMTPFFEKLKIQPRDFTKAQILYTEMLTEMEKVQPELFNGNLSNDKLATVSTSTLTTGQSSDIPLQMTDQMASKPAVSPKSTLDQLIEQKISRRALEPQNIQTLSTPVQKPQANMAQIFKMDPINQINIPSEAESVAISKLQALDPQLRIEDIKINPSKVTEQFLSVGSIAGATGIVASNTNEESQQEMTDEQMSDQALEQMIKMPTDKKVDNQFAVDKLGVQNSLNSNTKLSADNVEKLISNSQSLIQKGGGEMKIQLNPEGLGTVHLNIKVQDGQVGVQMMTDTVEAKKLLETSMNDLKISLAEQKLNLNQVKVDMSEQASQNMNHNHDFKREEARDFLGQFRQFNESLRQGAHDMSRVKAYRRPAQSSTPDINPIDSKRDPRRTDQRSGGLYLVA